MPGNCEHKNFKTEAKIYRLTDEDEGPVTGYRVDIEVHCVDCFKPFLWKGLPIGVFPNQPSTNFDRDELRAPIEPA